MIRPWPSAVARPLLCSGTSLDPVTWGIILGGVANWRHHWCGHRKRIVNDAANAQLVAAFHSLVGLAARAGRRSWRVCALGLSANIRR